MTILRAAPADPSEEGSQTSLRIEPSVVYFYSGPAFVAGSADLNAALKHPGGLLDYVSLKIVPLLRSGWAGGLVFTVVAFGLFCASL